MTSPLVYFLTAFGGSVVATRVCRTIARRLGYIARPQHDRWHERPTALLGGVAIVVVTIVAGLTIRTTVTLAALLAFGAFIAFVGLADDLFTLKPATKLIAQAVAASMLLFFGCHLNWTTSMIGDAMLTLLWIVGITNAFNLLDNMDGLCAGTAVIAGAFLLAAFLAGGGVTPAAQYLAALVGATAGFLMYNLNPASIFMGDTGSLFLGLNLAVLTLLDRPAGRSRFGLVSVVAVPVLLLLIPIADTTLVTVVRLLSGRRPSQGGLDHTSHRLVAIGLSPRRAVLILWALGLASGGLALSFSRDDVSWPVILAIVFVIAIAIFAVYLARVPVYDDADFTRVKDGPFTPLIVNLMYKHRIAEVLLDCCLIPLAYYASYRLRFENAVLAANYQYFIRSLPIVLAVQLVSMFVVGGYRGVWREFGMMDAVVFAKGVVMGTVGAQIVLLYAYRFRSYSRSVFVIDAALLMLLLAGTRASFRLLGEFVERRRTDGRRCLVYGISGASVATIREAFGADRPVKLLGFIDDDPLRRQTRVAGYTVLGGFDDLVERIGRGDVDCVVLNTHLVAVDRLRRLELLCRDHDVDLLKLHVDLRSVSAVS